jgi:hypothetical protein
VQRHFALFTSKPAAVLCVSYSVLPVLLYIVRSPITTSTDSLCRANPRVASLHALAGALVLLAAASLLRHMDDGFKIMVCASDTPTVAFVAHSSSLVAARRMK